MRELPLGAKKVISVIVTIGMIISLFSCMSGLSAFAIDNTPSPKNPVGAAIQEKAPAIVAETTEKGATKSSDKAKKADGHTHCICGNAIGSSVTLQNHMHDAESVVWTAWTSNNSLPSKGNYYLTKNVSIGATSPTTSVSCELNLCLNGYNIDYAGTDKLFAVLDSASVNICDCQNKSQINYNGTNTETSSGMVYFATAGTWIYNNNLYRVDYYGFLLDENYERIPYRGETTPPFSGPGYLDLTKTKDAVVGVRVKNASRSSWDRDGKNGITDDDNLPDTEAAPYLAEALITAEYDNSTVNIFGGTWDLKNATFYSPGFSNVTLHNKMNFYNATVKASSAERGVTAGGIIRATGNGQLGIYNSTFDGRPVTNTGAKTMTNGGIIDSADSATVNIVGSTLYGIDLKPSSSRKYDGGVLRVEVGSTVNITDSEIYGGKAYNGGAIRSGGTLNIVNTNIHGGEAIEGNGGAIYIARDSNATNAPTFTYNGGTIDGTSVTGQKTNGSYALGGAVFIGSYCTFVLYDGTIKGGAMDNAATSGVGNACGGAVYIQGGSSATMYMFGGKIDGSTSTFTSGTTSMGGALHISSWDHVLLAGGEIIGGTVSANGGAIYNDTSQLYITGGTRIVGGTANYGGAIYTKGDNSNYATAPGTSVTFQNATIIGGTAAKGGAIYHTTTTHAVSVRLNAQLPSQSWLNYDSTHQYNNRQTTANEYLNVIPGTSTSDGNLSNSIYSNRAVVIESRANIKGNMYLTPHMTATATNRISVPSSGNTDFYIENLIFHYPTTEEIGSLTSFNPLSLYADYIPASYSNTARINLTLDNYPSITDAQVITGKGGTTYTYVSSAKTVFATDAEATAGIASRIQKYITILNGVFKIDATTGKPVEGERYQCECGDTARGKPGHTCNALLFKGLDQAHFTDAFNAPSSSNQFNSKSGWYNIILTGDIDISKISGYTDDYYMNTSNTALCIDLNGHTWEFCNKGRFNTWTSGTNAPSIRITDSASGGTLIGKDGIYITTQTLTDAMVGFILYNGTCISESIDNAIYFRSGIVKMYGGEVKFADSVTPNTKSDAYTSTVHLNSTDAGKNPKFYQYGGKIGGAKGTVTGKGARAIRLSGTAANAEVYIYGEVEGSNISAYTETEKMNGGAIYASGSNTVNIYDGAYIHGGTASTGGNIYLTSATCNIYGGTIDGGVAQKFGGNIYNQAELNISGGVISNGLSNGAGGGNLFIGSVVPAIISGGLITDGKAPAGSGGNIFLDSGKTLNITGGEITRGSCKGSGGNLHTSTGDTHAEISNATFSCGKADANGDNININKSTVTISGNVKLLGGTYQEANEDEGTEAILSDGALYIVNGSVVNFDLGDEAVLEKVKVNTTCVLGTCDSESLAIIQNALDSNIYAARIYNNKLEIYLKDFALADRVKALESKDDVDLSNKDSVLTDVSAYGLDTGVWDYYGITNAGELKTEAALYNQMMEVKVYKQGGFKKINKETGESLGTENQLYVIYSALDDEHVANYDYAKIVITINGRTIGNNDEDKIEDAYKKIYYLDGANPIISADNLNCSKADWIYFSSFSLSNTNAAKTDVNYSIYVVVEYNGKEYKGETITGILSELGEPAAE